jgi:trk system potassium uptake protein TrkH
MRNAMNYKLIGKILGFILIIEALFLIPAWAISLGYHEANAAFSILKSQIIILIAAAVLVYVTRNAKHNYYA